MSGDVDAALLWLAQHQVPACLIGGSALSVRGYARYTEDVDLLVMDPRVLDTVFWTGGPAPLRLARGDEQDPLAGVVELGGRVEIIVGKGHAAEHALRTSEVVPSRGQPVATALALVLLKLEAGGPVDVQDILQLVSVQRALGLGGWVAEIAQHAPRLSVHAREVWQRVRPDVLGPNG